MSNINLIKLLPKSMRSDFWADFLDCVSTELELFKENIIIKQDTFNIRNLTEVSDLQEITNTFGFYPNTLLNSSSNFFKSEIKALSYRIKRKTTYEGYDYIFKSIPMIGYTYNLYWDDTSLIRAVDWAIIETNLLTYDYFSPFTGIIPQYYYSFIENIPFTLDDSPLRYLDSGLFLDTSILKTTTHHLAVEIFPTSLTTLNSINYLATRDYLDYVWYYANYNKKVTEFLHVGPHICLTTDNSRYYNNLNGGLSYTVPSLQAKFAVTQNYHSPLNIFDEFYTICAGTGQQTMYGIGHALGNINDLASQVYSRVLSNNEKNDDGSYYKISSYIPNGALANILLFIGDGSTSADSGILAYNNIIPFSVFISYYANNQQITLSDNGYGTIESATFNGTINYDTGAYDFNFVNVADELETLSSVGGISSYSGFLAFNTIQVETVKIYYKYNGSSRVINCDTFGHLNAGVPDFPFLSGTVTSAGAISITWSTAVDASPVTITYTYNNYSIPKLLTPVYINYKTSNSLEITEIGIKDQNNVLLAYAIVPPVDAPERPEYHTGVSLFIKQ